ncbi:hypothetical protein Drose_36365 [Dactylosporangium roseum]|uniref:Uncharacterized protein n=1 Tax=Dactylosporangium roseum TaxID=47989 RepID=A0ABY5Z6T3_9ACTN|nr:hypothetical protein Drose_36365 [Dactylosporangium roseum]
MTNLRRALSSNNKPDLYLDSGPSTIITAVLSFLEQSKILFFNIAPTTESADPSKFPLNFNLSPTLDTQGKGIATYAKERATNPRASSRARPPLARISPGRCPTRSRARAPMSWARRAAPMRPWTRVSSAWAGTCR